MGSFAAHRAPFGAASAMYLDERVVQWNGVGHILGLKNEPLAKAEETQDREGDLPNGRARVIAAFLFPSGHEVLKIVH